MNSDGMVLRGGEQDRVHRHCKSLSAKKYRECVDQGTYVGFGGIALADAPAVAIFATVGAPGNELWP